MVAYSFKGRFVTPIKVGLGQIEHIPGTEYVPKRQTIRSTAGKKRHARPGEMVQLFYGLRTKNCFPIGVARCISAERISIYVATDGINVILSGRILGQKKLRELAQADGFKDPAEMAGFWLLEHGVGNFVGVLIKWKPV